MLQAALELAEAGWAVFPVDRVTKAPLVARGVYAATTDPDLLRNWWTKHPDANPAVAVPPNCVVLDVDPRKGGDAQLARLEREHGAVPTLAVRTGGGGLHLFFEVEPGSASNQVDVAPGLDTRAEGGYVVAAGAVHESGQTYEWLNDLPPAPAPPWLLAAVRRKPANEVAAELIVRPFPAELEATRGAALAQLLRDHVWREGNKHAAALAVGGYLHKRGFSWETVEAVIRSLPSRHPENRVRDARDAWNAGDGGAGYQALARMAPELIEEFERLTAHPTPLFPLAQAGARPAPLVGPGTSLPPGALPSFADLVDALPEEGQDPEFRTGLDVLDEKIDGGIREGNAVAIGAPPDGGKTQLLFQIAWNLARQGVAVVWIAVDEEPRRLAERGLQTFCGASRAEARRPTPVLRRAARREHEALRAPVVFSESPLLEDAFGLVPELKAKYGAVAVIADSIQKVHVSQTFNRTTEEMARLNLVCDTARQLSRTGETRSMFLFSSEVSRSYYAIDSKGDPMGAFKGSSAIEYLATLALLLRPDHETKQVNVEIAKSKIGGGGQAFGLTKDGIRLVGSRFVKTKQVRVENDNMRVLGTVVEAGPINAVGGPMPVRVRDVLLQTMRRRDGKAIATGRLHKALTELKEQELIWFSPDSKQIVPTALGEAAWRRAKDPLLRSPELDGDSATE